MRQFLARLFDLRLLAIVLVALLIIGLTPVALLQIGKWEYTRRGRAAFDKGLYDEAISNYTKAIKLSPIIPKRTAIAG
jgi:tetratricopeptide (TPR) repeat protein